MKLTARILSIVLAAVCIFTFTAVWLGIKDTDSVRSKWNDRIDSVNDIFDDLESELDVLSENEEEYTLGIDTYIAGMKAIEEGEKVLAEGEQAIQQGAAALSAGYARINEGKAALAEGQAAYEQGLAEYEAAKAQLESGKAQLAAVEPLYNTAMGLYSQAQGKLGEAESARAAAAAAREEGDEVRAAELEAAAAVYEWEYQQAQEVVNYELNGYSISGLMGEYNNAVAQVAAGEEALAAAETQLAEGKATLDENAALLESAEAQIGGGYGRINSARQQLEDGRAQLEENAGLMSDKRDRLSEIETGQLAILDKIESAIATDTFYDENRKPLTESVRSRLGENFSYISHRVSEDTGDEFMLLDFDAAYDVVDAGRDFADDTLEAVEDELSERVFALKLCAAAAGAGLVAAILGICGVRLLSAILGFAVAAGSFGTGLWLLLQGKDAYPFSVYIGTKGSVLLIAGVAAAAVFALAAACFALAARKTGPAAKKTLPGENGGYSGPLPAGAYRMENGRIYIPRYDPALAEKEPQVGSETVNREPAVPAAAPQQDEGESVPAPIPVPEVQVGPDGRVRIPRYRPAVLPAQGEADTSRETVIF